MPVRSSHDVEVLLVQPRGAHPRRPAVRVAELGEVRRAHAALGGAHEQVAQLVAERAQPQHVRAGPRAGQASGTPSPAACPASSSPSMQVLLGARRRAWAAARPSSAARARRTENAAAAAVCTSGRPEVAPQPRREPVPQVRGRAPARGEDQHVVRVRDPRSTAATTDSSATVVLPVPGRAEHQEGRVRRRARRPRPPRPGRRRGGPGEPGPEAGTSANAGRTRRRAGVAVVTRTSPSRATDRPRTTRAGHGAIDARSEQLRGTATRSATQGATW